MKTSELTGAHLDYWVGRAEGLPVGIDSGVCCYVKDEKTWPKDPFYRSIACSLAQFSPSTNWAQGGPIIERAAIPVRQLKERHFPNWQAGSQRCFGPTPLIAAMRCYVASKFGDEVVS